MNLPCYNETNKLSWSYKYIIKEGISLKCEIIMKLQDYHGIISEI